MHDMRILPTVVGAIITCIHSVGGSSSIIKRYKKWTTLVTMN